MSYNNVSVKVRQELETERQKYCTNLVILQLEADKADNDEMVSVSENRDPAEEEEGEEM